jgi:hypothetical protein
MLHIRMLPIMKKMKMPFITEIDKIQSLDSIFLSQGEYSGVLDQYLNNGEFNLYYITYVDKYRFDLEQCRIEQDKLIVRFLNREEEYSLDQFNIQSLDTENSNSRSISLTDIDGQILRITINEFIINYCQEISRDQEIIYIGQSQNIANRLQNHEKLIRAFASLPDGKEVLINFIKPSFGYVDLENQQLIHFNNGTISHTSFQTFKYQELINLTERVLIKFYKPRLNIDFINTDFSNDNTISNIKYIAQNEIFIFSNQINENGYNFYSTNQILNTTTFLLNDNYQFENYEE